MPYLQISDVLERMQRFHATLSTCFDTARDEQNPEHARALALGIDRRLLSVYERIASAQVPSRVQDLFSQLAEMQRSRMLRRALENLDSEI